MRMIGKLKGIVDDIGEDCVLVDVQGVCYLVHCSNRTLSEVGKCGEACTLFIETYVREDQFKLFGFTNAFEREWFLLLQTVQGIGAKLALAVQSMFTPGQLATLISLQDKATLSKAQGVGPKAAERIVLELKNKIPRDLGDTGNAITQITAGPSTPVAQAISAIANLGYSKDQAVHAVSIAHNEAGPEADNVKLIRLALRELSRI